MKTLFEQEFVSMLDSLRMSDSVDYYLQYVSDERLLGYVKRIDDNGRKITLTLENPWNGQYNIVPVFPDNVEAIYANLWQFHSLQGFRSYRQECRLHLEELPVTVTDVDLGVLAPISRLSHLYNLARLSLMYGNVEWEEIDRLLPNLRTLMVTASIPDNGLKCLNRLEQLQCWTLPHKFPCECLQNLKTLHLNLYEYETLGSLSELANLEKLAIYSAGLRSLGGIEKLRKLKELEIHRSGTYGIEDINAIRGLPLKVLNLSNMDAKNFSALSTLLDLEQLHLNGTLLNELSLLAPLSMVRTLEVFGIPATDTNALEALTRLKWLNIADVQWQKVPKVVRQQAKRFPKSNDIEDILKEIEQFQKQHKTVMK